MSVYVEADKCAKELGVRERGGFFANDDDFCSAILDGAFKKALVVRPGGAQTHSPSNRHMCAHT